MDVVPGDKRDDGTDYAAVAGVFAKPSGNSRLMLRELHLNSFV